MLQLLESGCLEPVLHSKRSHCKEKPVHHNEEKPPLSATRENSQAAKKIRHNQKKRKKNPQQNISKPSPTIHKKDHIPQCSWIHPGLQRWFNICKSINLIHCINKPRDRSHMIILIGSEKALDKIQYPFMTKNSHQSGYREKISRHTKSYSKPTANIIPTVKSQKLSHKFRNKTWIPTLTTSMQYSTRSLSHSNQTRKGNKKHPN